MSGLSKAVKLLENNIATLQRGLKFAQEIPLYTPIRFTYLGAIRDEKGHYKKRTLEGAGIATKHNPSSFRFLWAAVNTTLKVYKPWCGDSPLIKRPDEHLQYSIIETWAPLEQRELPLLMTWHYRSVHLKDLFA
jgi:hypothetical protein